MLTDLAVPQHVSTVPHLRSPPPPASQNAQAQGGYGYGQSPPQPQGAGGVNYMQNFMSGNFANDPNAQMGFQIGKSAVMAGQEYVEQNVSLISPPFV